MGATERPSPARTGRSAEVLSWLSAMPGRSRTAVGSPAEDSTIAKAPCAGQSVPGVPHPGSERGAVPCGTAAPFSCRPRALSLKAGSGTTGDGVPRGRGDTHVLWRVAGHHGAINKVQVGSALEVHTVPIARRYAGAVAVAAHAHAVQGHCVR